MTGWEIKDDLMEDESKVPQFLKDYTLAALNPAGNKLFIIRKYDAQWNCPPENQDHYRWCIAMLSFGSYTYFVLPKTLEYKSIEAHNDLKLTITTNRGVVETSVPQLSHRLSDMFDPMTEEVLLHTFFDLPNTVFPKPPKPITQTHIDSTVFGAMAQDQFDDWWTSKPQSIPLFENVVLPIQYINFNPNEDADFVKQADQAITNVLSKTLKDRAQYTAQVYKNCTDFIDMIGNDYDEVDWYNLPPEAIWKYVTPTEILVSRELYNDKGVYTQIICDCEWEIEHGLQLVFNQKGDLVRVSEADGDIL